MDHLVPWVSMTKGQFPHRAAEFKTFLHSKLTKIIAISLCYTIMSCIFLLCMLDNLFWTQVIVNFIFLGVRYFCFSLKILKCVQGCSYMIWKQF